MDSRPSPSGAEQLRTGLDGVAAAVGPRRGVLDSGRPPHQPETVTDHWGQRRSWWSAHASSVGSLNQALSSLRQALTFPEERSDRYDILSELDMDQVRILDWD